MHILLGLLVLICFFISPRFRLLVFTLLGSLLLGTVLALVVGTVNESLGVFIGIIAFIFSLTSSFKIFKYMSRVVFSGIGAGLDSYVDERSKGKKHETALIEGGQDALGALLRACIEEDQHIKKISPPDLSNTPEAKRLKLMIAESVVNDSSLIPEVGVEELFEAIRKNELELMEKFARLLSKDRLYRIVNTPDEIGNFPLHYAVQSGYNHILPWLVKHGADIHAKNDWCNTPLDSAQRVKNLEAISFLSSLKKSDNESVTIQKRSISAGIELVMKDSPVISEIGIDELLGVIRKNEEGLLDKFAEPLSKGRLHRIVNTADEIGSFPLHYAVKSGCNRVIPWLVKHGADIHRKNDWGSTPLNSAQRAKNRDAVNYLSSLQAGKGDDLFDLDKEPATAQEKQPPSSAQHRCSPLKQQSNDALISQDLEEFNKPLVARPEDRI